jgi:alpha-soluble NSF attachment protein
MLSTETPRAVASFPLAFSPKRASPHAHNVFLVLHTEKENMVLVDSDTESSSVIVVVDGPPHSSDPKTPAAPKMAALSGNEAKAADMMVQAEKKVKGGVFGGIFGNAQMRLEEGAEMYVRAANLYKLAKNHVEAANAFQLAAECQLKAENKHEAAAAFVNGAKVLQKHDAKASVEKYRQAVELFTDEGRFSIAAKHQKEIAELLEADGDAEAAIEAYQQAADFFEGENSTSNANNCLLKVANMSATLEQYDRAIELYEQVAKASLDNNLLKWGVKDYFFRAVLCHLANGDEIAAKEALEKYTDWDPTFGSQREAKFLDAIINAVQEYDADAFTDAVVEYDSISKLDAWKTSLLLKIKKGVKQDQDDDGLA